MYPAPNQSVLEAQARICTGPHLTRPLLQDDGGPKPQLILNLIFNTLRGTLPRQEVVSPAQMGAFFAAMHIRQHFDEKTGWSKAEQAAFREAAGKLEQMPASLRFLLWGTPTSVGTQDEKRTVQALGAVLSGGHLGYTETRSVLSEILAGGVRAEFMAAFLIGQRMNLENIAEVRAYLDAVLPPEEVLDIEATSLTHFGQPFDGAGRHFRPTLFIAAVRAAQKRPTVLHGVDELAPKYGITEEQILTSLGARVDLSREEGALLLRDVGFVYISQREYAPAAYNLRNLRLHIKKRPPWAATEKAQQLYRCSGRNCAAIGFYHPGYEGKLLELLRQRGYQAGLAIKGEEGSSHYGLRLGKASDEKRKSINYTEGFSGGRTIAEDVEPRDFGFFYGYNPRAEKTTADAFARAGLQALRGERGPAYDRIILNAGVTDFFLGFCDNARDGVAEARRTVDDGSALQALEQYIDRSRNV